MVTATELDFGARSVSALRIAEDLLIFFRLNTLLISTDLLFFFFKS